MYYIPQVSKSGCGYACLKTILATLNKDKNYMYLKEKEDEKGTSFQTLINLAKENGLTLVAYELKEKNDISDIKELPAIIALDTNDNKKHSIVVEKIKDNKIKIYDPSIGSSWIKIDSLLEKWDGVILCTKEHVQTPSQYQEAEIFSKNKLVVPYFLQIISAVLAFLAVFYLNPNNKLIMSVVLLLFAVILTTIMKYLLSNETKQCDKRMVDNINQIDKKKYFEYYKRYETYKGMYSSEGLNVILHFLITVAVSIISILNNAYYFVAIIIPIALCLFDYAFVSPILRKQNSILENEEESLNKIETLTQFEMKVNSIHEKSHKYFRIVYFKKIMTILILALSAMFISRITNSLSITDTIFTICIELFITENVNPILNYESSQKESLKVKIRLNNLFK